MGCSGNFTFEQLVSRYAEPGAILSNDVSLYTCSLGGWLTGIDFNLKPASEEWAWLGPYLASPELRPAVVVLLLEFLQYDPLKGDYHRRMHEHYVNRWDQYLEETADNLAKAREHLRVDQFFAGDVFDFYQANDRCETVFVSFMPTYAGGYERLYKKLAQAVSWNEPTYSLLDDERRDEIYDWITARDYVIYDDRELDLPLVFIDRKGGSARDVFMYSNLDLPRAMLDKHRNMAPSPWKFVGPEDEITPKTRIDFLAVESKVINYYREMFLSKDIAFVDGQLSLLVFADGKLFGFLIFNLAKFGGAKSGAVYMLSDFVVPYSRYARLSKLLLFLVTTTTIKQTLEEKFWNRFKTVYTTAFTDKPVSMKYRGVFDLVKRGEGFLNYSAELGTRTIKGALTEWTQKFGKKLTASWTR